MLKQMYVLWQQEVVTLYNMDKSCSSQLRKNNIPMMITANPGQYLESRNSRHVRWRMKEIQLYQPKIIIAQQYWVNFLPRQQNGTLLSTEDVVRNIIDPLLNVTVPPKLIILFGDNPEIDMPQKSKIQKYLKMAYSTEQQYFWTFLNNLNVFKIEQFIKSEVQIKRVIQKNYDTNIVKFYPSIHQLMQNPYTGKLKLFGSEANGQYLYIDQHHLTTIGSKRYKKYFKLKIFDKAKKLCKSSK